MLEVFHCTLRCLRYSQISKSAHVWLENLLILEPSKGIITYIRCGSRIWLRGAQLPWPKVVDVVKWSHVSEVSYLRPGFNTYGSLWVFNAQICILLHSRDSLSLIFDIYFNTKS